MNFTASSDAKADQSVVSSSTGGRVEEGGDGVGSGGGGGIVSSSTVGGGGNKIRGHVSRIAITNSREDITTTTDATHQTTSTETTDAGNRQINNNFKEFFVSTPPQTHAVRREISFGFSLMQTFCCF